LERRRADPGDDLEWLRRIPPFRAKPGETPRTAAGIVHTVLSLPLSWEALV